MRNIAPRGQTRGIDLLVIILWWNLGVVAVYIIGRIIGQAYHIGHPSYFMSIGLLTGISLLTWTIKQLQSV